MNCEIAILIDVQQTGNVNINEHLKKKQSVLQNTLYLHVHMYFHSSDGRELVAFSVLFLFRTKANC